MQDTSLLPQWNAEAVLTAIGDNKIDQKMLKNKQDRFYMITSYNEQEYLSDVRDVYDWIRLANVEPLHKFIISERVQKMFLEEFIAQAIKDLILCKKFKHKIMMIFTQQIMVYSLNLFMKFYNQLEKYPKMTVILRIIFDYEKQFYRQNYANEHPYLVVPPTPLEISQSDKFIEDLSISDQVDVLKTELHSKRLCWLPAIVKKITTINVYVNIENEKGSSTFDRKSLQVAPFRQHLHDYEWRFNLQKDHKVDFQDSQGKWKECVVNNLRITQTEDVINKKIIEVELQTEDEQMQWISITDARIQKNGSIVKLDDELSYFHSPQSCIDDFNDMLFDPEMKKMCLVRPETVKSQLYIDLIMYIHQKLNMLDIISQSISDRKFGIQITSDLVGFIQIIHYLFHRKFALQYLNTITNSLLNYMSHLEQGTIRKFTKQRYETICLALGQFLKRLKSTNYRKQIVQKFQMDLSLRFLYSDFLDRKLESVTMITSFLKLSKHSIMLHSSKEIDEWIKQNKVIPAIFNEKSHSELINRSADFMQLFLTNKPKLQDLNPLLEWNEAIIKLISQLYEYFPNEFQESIVKKIKEKSKVQNKDALNIVKKTVGCETWLLKNGGQSWVQIVKEKPKRKADIVQVFTCDFPVVMKITKEVAGIYQCRFKSQYFLHINQINYLCTVLSWKDVDIKAKLDFANLALEPISKISDETFASFLPLTRQVNDSLPAQYQQFFVGLLSKLTKKQTKQLFESNFEKQQLLQILGQGQFELFKKCFMTLNEEVGNIDKRVIYKQSAVHSYRKQKEVIMEIKVNPNKLIGMSQLLLIIYENKLISVTEKALKLIGFLFDFLAPNIANCAVQFKTNFLNNCLQKFYQTQNQQQKFLKIISKLMNESQKEGCDLEPSVSALFPLESITIRLNDNFNINKSKFALTVPSNLTLYQLRAHIGRNVNAYVHEMKITINGKQLDSRLNGHVVHTLKFPDYLLIQKKAVIERVPLSEHDGTLSEKAKIVFKNIFREFSTLGHMSKQQCQKYHQRCIGEVSSLSESRVQKIYDQYDTDKDGYLTEEDFLKFYQNASRTKEISVWSNLESFGVRNDLQILTNLQITHPEPTILTRNLLFQNEQFMERIFQILECTEENVAGAAWDIVSRLPLYFSTTRNFNLNQKYSFRYWLYLVEHRNQHEKVTEQILNKIIHADIETMCIGLKVSLSSSAFNKEIFRQLMFKLASINKLINLDFHSKVILDCSLKIISQCFRLRDAVRQEYLSNSKEYNQIMSLGLMSPNSQIRVMYCQAIKQLMEEVRDTIKPVFQALFELVYGNFEKADKSTLHIEYFDLFSQLLEMLSDSDESNSLDSVNLNWKTLTTSMIKQYQEHKCREESLNSPPDQVAQGFLRIISKLLNENNLEELTPLVRFIFQRSLFPETGLNKLKNSKSRKDAYELIYEICKLRNKDGQTIALQELFLAGFKQVYKKMSHNKPTYSFSYYYSYNQARSELGYAGIRNLGCICYMISMLQQLYMTPAFRYLTLMADDGEPDCLVKKGTKEIDDNVFHQLQTLFANLDLTERQEFNPDQFCFSFKDFEGNPVNVSVQHDAQQFLNIFFDKLQTSLKQSPFKHTLENIFGGKSCNRTVCSNCKAIKERQQNFYPLSLEIKGYKDIHESFKKFIQGQVISDYQCDFCNKKTDVTKSCFVSKAPDNFIIHLQRMCFNYDKFENQKINQRWQFPQLLDIYDYSLAKQNSIEPKPNQFQFRLRGIVVHYGSADFGHYFSYIRETDTKWIQFNDQRIREFDPRDIQLECFGGEHWRRESQSAYLLVYEKLQQSSVKLQFDTQQQKIQILSKFKLSEVKEINLIKEQSGPQTPERQKQVISQKSEKVETESEKGSESESQKPKQIQKKKIITMIDPHKIIPYIPQKLAAKINKANQEFSFSINLSNDEFAYFVYKILSINPPQQLTNEYLELSYQCFHLKQVVDEDEGITLAEWAARRFKEIITGHGWEFLKNFGQNWQSDILSIEKTTRVGMKNLLQCVISDIIGSNKLNEEQEQTTLQSEEQANKREIVINFLDKYTQMLNDDVPKHWPRFRQYFEVWCNLVSNNSFVRRYCEQKMFIERLLDFIMEDASIISRTYKKHQMGNQYCLPQFQCPLDLICLLIKYGYDLNQLEKKCMGTYAFLSKIILYPTEHYNLIDLACRNNSPVSEKISYMLLTNCAKVSQSDQIKPFIRSIHALLQIDDQLQPKRIQWIIGFPQHIEHHRTQSYGIYGISPEHDYVVQFFSPLSAQPLLQQTIKFKTKAQHVGALLLSFLLQEEAYGHIYNLEAYPAAFAMQINYTHWFAEFVENYYEEMHQPYTGKPYSQYGKRLKNLWTNRISRPIEFPFPYLIGKTIDKEDVSDSVFQEVIEIEQKNVISCIVKIDPKKPMSLKTLKKLPNNQNFLPKSNTSYALYSLSSAPLGRLKQSSEEEQSSQQQINPFDSAISTTLFRIVRVKNISSESLLIVVKLKAEGQSNILLPVSELSIDIRQNSYHCLSFIKKDLSKDFGKVNVQVKILGKSPRSTSWPKQIITETESKQQDDRASSDQDSGQNWPSS